jgi:uncharacterized protein (DUF934 family)
MALGKGGKYADDAFSVVADDAALPDGKPVIVSLKRFVLEKEVLLAREAYLGVRLETGDSPEALGEDVQRLAVVQIVIPYFKDGRVFSQARVLRTRMNYKNEIRVTGHFLRDQIAFLARVGVDAFDLSQNLSPDDIKDAMNEISVAYQHSVDGQKSIWDLRQRR